MTWRSRMSLITSAVAEDYGVTVARIQSRRRNPEFAIPRMVAMYLCREILGQSTTAVGRHFDRDHTTVLHAVKCVSGNPELKHRAMHIAERVRPRLETDAETDALIESITDKAAQALKARLRELAKLDGADILKHLGREI